MVKFSGTTGAELWRQVINGTANDIDRAEAVTVDAAGDVVAAGSTLNTGTSEDFTVVKFRGTDGAVLWSRNINGTANLEDGAFAVTVDAAGDVVAAGITENTGTSVDFTVVKFSGTDGSDFSEVLTVAIDIMPQSCPNPLNVKSKGVLPVAILGTDTFDVDQVDPDSVMLAGVEPLRWALDDVATPKTDDCTTDGPDGIIDLTLKFDTQEIVGVLPSVNDGDTVILQLGGSLKAEFSGTPIEGEDVVVILKKGKKANQSKKKKKGKK